MFWSEAHNYAPRSCFFYSGATRALTGARRSDTGPQEASLGIVRKGVAMFTKLNVPILGSFIPIVLPALVVIFCLLFAILSVFKLKNKAL